MERQEGYYWVKYRDDYTVAEWDGELWYATGIEYPKDDIEFEFINENRIKFPGELPD